MQTKSNKCLQCEGAHIVFLVCLQSLVTPYEPDTTERVTLRDCNTSYAEST